MKNLSMEKTNPTFLGGWTLNMFFLIRNTVIFFFFLVPTFSTWDLCSFQRSFIWLILRKGITQSHQFNEVGDSEFQPRNSSQHLFDDLVPKPFTMGYLYIYILYGFIFSSPPPPKEIYCMYQFSHLPKLQVCFLVPMGFLCVVSQHLWTPLCWSPRSPGARQRATQGWKKQLGKFPPTKNRR